MDTGLLLGILGLLLTALSMLGYNRVRGPRISCYVPSIIPLKTAIPSVNQQITITYRGEAVSSDMYLITFVVVNSGYKDIQFNSTSAVRLKLNGGEFLDTRVPFHSDGLTPQVSVLESNLLVAPPLMRPLEFLELEALVRFDPSAMAKRTGSPFEIFRGLSKVMHRVPDVPPITLRRSLPSYDKSDIVAFSAMGGVTLVMASTVVGLIWREYKSSRLAVESYSEPAKRYLVNTNRFGTTLDEIDGDARVQVKPEALTKDYRPILVPKSTASTAIDISMAIMTVGLFALTLSRGWRTFSEWRLAKVLAKERLS